MSWPKTGWAITLNSARSSPLEFDLDRVGLTTPGYLTTPSGTIYELVFIGRSGEAFPSGVEIYAIVPALEPLDDAAVDHDLWAILRWMVDGIGGVWSADMLDATGRLYKLAVTRR